MPVSKQKQENERSTGRRWQQREQDEDKERVGEMPGRIFVER
jgi:hypothetical protein